MSQLHQLGSMVKRAIIASTLATLAIGSSNLKAKCAPDPLAVKLPPVVAVRQSAIDVLIAVAQNKHICFGIEGVEQLKGIVTLKADNLTFRDVLAKVAPQIRVQMENGVVSLQSAKNTPTWLDIPITLDIPKPTDINWAAIWELGTAFHFATTKGGLVGSILGSGVSVGPYPKQTRTVRSWLNLFTRDSGGGFWATLRVLAKTDSPPSTQPWVLLLFTSPVKINQDQVADHLPY